MWLDYHILDGWAMEDIILEVIKLDDGLKYWLQT
jgi:hypothetical protein